MVFRWKTMVVPSRTQTHAGSRFVQRFEESVDDNGQIVIAPGKIVDQYALVQEAECPDIYEIMKSTGLDREPLEALKALKEQVAVDVADFSKAPRSLPEAYNLLIKAGNSFKQINPDIRKEFNNNAGEFLASYMDGTLDKRLERFMPKSQEVVENVDK